MKNIYSTPECDFLTLSQEGNIMSASRQTIQAGSSSGSDMDAADYSQNPF